MTRLKNRQQAFASRACAHLLEPPCWNPPSPHALPSATIVSTRNHTSLGGPGEATQPLLVLAPGLQVNLETKEIESFCMKEQGQTRENRPHTQTPLPGSSSPRHTSTTKGSPGSRRHRSSSLLALSTSSTSKLNCTRRIANIRGPLACPVQTTNERGRDTLEQAVLQHDTPPTHPGLLLDSMGSHSRRSLIDSSAQNRVRPLDEKLPQHLLQRRGRAPL